MYLESYAALSKAHEERSRSHRVRIFVENGIPFFAATDIAECGGITAPAKWVQRYAKNGVLKTVKLSYPIMTKRGLRKFDMFFIDADEVKRVIEYLPIQKETRDWIVDIVSSYEKRPPVDACTHDNDAESIKGSASKEIAPADVAGATLYDYERRIDEIIVELLEMKQRIRTTMKAG